MAGSTSGRKCFLALAALDSFLDGVQGRLEKLADRGVEAPGLIVGRASVEDLPRLRGGSQEFEMQAQKARQGVLGAHSSVRGFGPLPGQSIPQAWRKGGAVFFHQPARFKAVISSAPLTARGDQTPSSSLSDSPALRTMGLSQRRTMRSPSCLKGAAAGDPPPAAWIGLDGLPAQRRRQGHREFAQGQPAGGDQKLDALALPATAFCENLPQPEPALQKVRKSSGWILGANSSLCSTPE